MTLDLGAVARALGGDVRNGQVLAPGPGHSAADRSLSVRLDTGAPDGFMVHSFAGDDPIVCRYHVRAKLGLPKPKLKGNGKSNGDTGGNGAGDRWHVLREHIYRDERGEPYLRVRKLRKPDGGEQYAQAHWGGKQWIKDKPSGPKIPYRLPELLAAPATTPIYFCEGEKDADNLVKLSLIATTASEGASAKWDDALTPYFKDRHIIILPDADKPGRVHARKVAKAIDNAAASVRVLDLYPDRTDGSDVSNWLEDDTAGVRLAKLAKEAPVWEPGSTAGSDSGEDGKSGDELIAELAALPPLQYEKRREEAAEQLGIRVSVLDKLVEKERGEGGDEDKSPAHWGVERWSEPVATGDLLNELSAIYARHVILPEHGETAMALWNLHAWTHDAAYCSPFLMFQSPEPRCGKSTALSLLHWTGPRTVLASLVSPAALFRYIELVQPTLLIDEAETNESDEARGILNSGHSRDTAFVIRCEGDDHEPRQFSTWGPKAIASIGKLAATLRDRAIILPMKRKKRGERVKKLRGRDTDDFRTLREKAQRWATDNMEALRDAEPSLPEQLNDRACDNWEPLFAIADLAGGDWPKQARAAALKLSGDPEIEAQTMGARLLAGIKSTFEALGIDRITSAGLAKELGKDAEGPWAAFGRTGKPITQRQIAKLLDLYEIEPRVIRVPGVDGTSRGYELGWFTDAFERYLPQHPTSQSATSATPLNLNEFKPNLSATDLHDVADKNSEKSCENKLVADVADKNTPLQGKQGNGASEGHNNAPSLPAGAAVIGKAAPGERCHLCGKSSSVFIIRRRPGDEPDQMHVGCAAEAWVGESLTGTPWDEPPDDPEPPPPDGAPEPAEDRTCAQCGCPPDGTEQRCSVGDGLIWLHHRCQRPYLDGELDPPW